MPLICDVDSITTTAPPGLVVQRRQSKQSDIAIQAIMASVGATSAPSHQPGHVEQLAGNLTANGPSTSPPTRHEFRSPQPPSASRTPSMSKALNDTPDTTAPNSPRLLAGLADDLAGHACLAKIGLPKRQNSGSSTPRIRPTTLDIPGLTKSKVSPDGRIASRDVGAKLVIVMVGLPARGKSYITKKLARYLNWLQHDTRIFNVGEKRRVVAGGQPSPARSPLVHPQNGTATPVTAITPGRFLNMKQRPQPFPSATSIMLNGEPAPSPPGTPQIDSDTRRANSNKFPNGKDSVILDSAIDLPAEARKAAHLSPEPEPMDQSASFFDPSNKHAASIREQCAMDTLDELLDYILDGNGSVGILDATNSTLKRRKAVMKRIRERAGPDLNVLFLESRCVNEQLLESNMRLKLSGPDYKDRDPFTALDDFRRRVALYEKSYIPLGDYEEQNDMPYIQMIDVGRKIISHQIKGFLMAQANYYLLNFNLAPRQIWITRHGLSQDNISGKIGGDSDLSDEGVSYARALSSFMNVQRNEWELRQIHKMQHSHFPPQPGDTTPPNPHYEPNSYCAAYPHSPEGSDVATPPDVAQKPFCVWTSMLKRSIQTGQFFDEEEYDIKQMRMLDELNAGIMEGLTYSSIASVHPQEYAERKKDKLHYRYPGPGGEGYLDIINRLRPVIVELERMTDHVLLIGHRSVARVLLAYFLGLRREEVAELDVPIGMIYCLEPKPYGVEFKAYRWAKDKEWFYEEPEFKLQRDEKDML